MGAYPSVSSVPSSAIQQDVKYLKDLFPNKFKVEPCLDANSDTMTLFAKDGNLTLILMASGAGPPTSPISSTAALVLEDSDIKSVLKRQGKPIAKSTKHEPIRAIIELPGGSVLVLVSPSMMGSKTGRQKLVQILTDYSNKSTPQRTPPPTALSESSTPSNPQSVDAIDDHDQNNVDLQRYNLPAFPTLDFRLLQKNGQMESNFPLNTRTGVPFETELFKGKVLFLLRPANNPAQEDPYWNEKIWAHKQRRVIVQVQGKFKTKPRGILFAGGEISEPMKLGLLAKGLIKVLVKLLKSFYPTIHLSFGDDDEMAHIVVPAYRFFERLVVTPPGQTPPTIGEPFEESKESIKARKSAKGVGEWDPANTYSMSFYSMYIDLPSWSVVNIPMSSDMPLSTFWGQSFLRILFYDRVVPPDSPPDERHLPKYNNYGFVVEAKYLGSSGKQPRSSKLVDRVPDSDEEQEVDASSDPDHSETERGILYWTESPSSRDKTVTATTAMPRSESQAFMVEDRDEVQEDVSVFDMDAFFDAEEYGDSSGFKLEEGDNNKLGSSVVSHDSSLLKSVDNLCPAWMELIEPRGNYARTYALNLPTKKKTIFRTPECVRGVLETEDLQDNICSPRMSSAEKTRRRFGQLVATCSGHDKGNSRLKMLQADKFCTYDDKFLNRQKPSIGERGKVHSSCFVARALSDHHWLEEFMNITDRGVNFYHPERTRANHRVTMHTIARVETVAGSDAPCFPNHFFMAFETLGRTTYLMFASEKERNDVVKLISRLAKLTPNAVDSLETSSYGKTATALMELQQDLKDEFLHKSSMWDFKHRRVLNCRRFSFRTGHNSSQDNPLALAEDALRKALDPRNESDDEILVAFLDSAAKLKDANVHGLAEQERLAFFLNIYHIMIMHAYLVLGVPRSSFQWISYFNSISYQCSDDIFSLAELEHCIIRSSMSFPTQFLSRFVLPKSVYDFALTKSEYRINFALNCGSKSNPKSVPVFTPAILDKQLDDVSRLYISSCVKIKKRSSKEVDLYLPRICLWFSNDFGSGNEYILRRVKPFLTTDVQDLIASSSSGERGKCHISIKFLQYDFECRKLVLATNTG